MKTLQDKILGIRLKSLMMARGISLTTLSKVLDITPTYLSLIANGKKKPSKKVVAKAVKYFDMTVEELNAVPKCLESIAELLADETDDVALLCAYAIIDQKQS